MSSSSSEPKLQDSESKSAAPETLESRDPPIDSKEVQEGGFPENLVQSENVSENGVGGGGEGDGGEDQEEEEEGECGFCLFMKEGGCRDSFIAWEKCIEEAEKKKEDIVEKCFEVTGALKKCMEAHSDYYEPILKAEKSVEDEATIELEKASHQNTNSRDLEGNVGSENLEQRKDSTSISDDDEINYSVKPEFLRSRP